MIYRFHTTASDYQDYNGHLCQIVRELDSDEVDIEDIGPMYEVSFSSDDSLPFNLQKTIHVFDDEIFEVTK